MQSNKICLPDCFEIKIFKKVNVLERLCLAVSA